MRHRLIVHRLTMPANLAKRGEGTERAGDHTFEGAPVDWAKMSGSIDQARASALLEVSRLYPLDKVRAVSVTTGGFAVTLEFRRG